jgi:hypothetical protein
MRRTLMPLFNFALARCSLFSAEKQAKTPPEDSREHYFGARNSPNDYQEESQEDVHVPHIEAA